MGHQFYFLIASQFENKAQGIHQQSIAFLKCVHVCDSMSIEHAWIPSHIKFWPRFGFTDIEYVKYHIQSKKICSNEFCNVTAPQIFLFRL